MARILPATLAAFALTAAPHGASAADPGPSTRPDAPLGYWLTDDGSLIVEMRHCHRDDATLCGFIRALPTAADDAEIAAFAAELCGQPLLGAFSYDRRRKRWTDGRIYDFETEESYAATVWTDGGVLKVRAFEGVELNGLTMEWTAVEASSTGCEAAARR
ncbi:MAG: DUF2147 domain-containing protein [Caulobacterales bacterium]|nr:DUF2147 domain-containing protein [Caulobacterales bacterium]